jgi:GT2 family glycosyltransferase
MITLGLVIRNEERQLPRFFAALSKLPKSEFSEILIADNDSCDGSVALTEELLRQSGIPGRVLKRSQNSLPDARNQILREAKSDWIYFTDADCELQVQSWKNLKNAAETAAMGTAAVGGGNRPPGQISFIDRGVVAMSLNWWSHMGSIQIRPPLGAAMVSLLSSCNLLLRKSAALSVSGFDERFKIVGEDLSLCLRLREAGWQLQCVPEADVLHWQDRGLWNWCCRMFFYGEAQVRVARFYPRHFAGVRGLQFAALLMVKGLFLWRPIVASGVLGIYSIVIFLGWPVFQRRSLRERCAGLALTLLSQVSYGLGEVYGVLRLLLAGGRKTPAMRPILEKK